MRILFLSKNKLQEDAIRNNLQSLSEQDSVKFVYSFTEAEDFIDNQIIKSQLALDLIIMENGIDGESADDFRQKIQKDKKRSFSNRDFNFCSVPVMLIVDSFSNKNSYRHFTHAIDDLGMDKLHLFIPKMISSVKSWRTQVLDELDNLGVRDNSGIIDYKHVFSKDRKRQIETIVLSDEFKIFPRRLQYEWISLNEKEIERALDEYIKQLKQASRLSKKREEKKFHGLFNKYQFLLKRDNYYKYWYEPKLYLDDDKYYEPDYVLKPNFTYKTDLSILEVKLPNEGFISKSKFHPRPYQRIIDHIFQVNDYKDYLESDEYQELVKRIFGFLPTRLEYNILIGRLDDKNQNLGVFNKRMSQIKATHINFITYDELLDYQVKFLERMRLLKII